MLKYSHGKTSFRSANKKLPLKKKQIIIILNEKDHYNFHSTVSNSCRAHYYMCVYIKYHIICIKP